MDRSWPTASPCVHLKDMAVKGWEPIMAPVGEGNLPWGKPSPPWRSAAKPVSAGGAGRLPGEPLHLPGEELQYLNSLGYK